MCIDQKKTKIVEVFMAGNVRSRRIFRDGKLTIFVTEHDMLIHFGLF